MEEMEEMHMICPRCGAEAHVVRREVNYGRGEEYQDYLRCFDCGYGAYVGPLYTRKWSEVGWVYTPREVSPVAFILGKYGFHINKEMKR